jgi:SAM-dependent methyltransferase
VLPPPPTPATDLTAPGLTGYRRAARLLSIQPGMRVLVAGCGRGQGAWLLARLGADVLGVDQSAAIITTATRLYGDQPLPRGGRLQYARADFATWQPPAAFDAIVAVDDLPRLPPSQAVARLRRLLRGLHFGAAGLFLHLPMRPRVTTWARGVRDRLPGAPQPDRAAAETLPPVSYAVAKAVALVREAGGQFDRVELRAARFRLRPLERALVAHTRPGLLLRLATPFVTDLDAVLLPELEAVLRHLTPPGGA